MISIPHWERISELIAAGQAILVREAYREIQAKDDELQRWIRERDAVVVESSAEELEIVRNIAQHHPEWVRGQKNSADSFIIAAAKVRGAVVVTDERPSGWGAEDRNLRLPTVAEEAGVECITPTELVRRCGWRF